MVTKVTFVGDGFTRKPPKYERFIRPMVSCQALSEKLMFCFKGQVLPKKAINAFNL